MERARVSPLAWGNARQQAIIASQYSSFDTIVGADVVYAPEAIPSLFAACGVLLSQDAHARLILCHIVRRVSENTIIEAAEAAGFRVAQCNQEFTGAAEKAIAGGPFRLLTFCKTS